MKEVCNDRNKKIRGDMRPWPFKAFEESNKRITEEMWKKTAMCASSVDRVTGGISQMLAVLNIYADMNRTDIILCTHLRRIVEGNEMSCVWMREQAGRSASLQRELAIAKATYGNMCPVPQADAGSTTEPDSNSARPEKGQDEWKTVRPKTARDLKKGSKDLEQVQHRGKQQQQQQQEQEQQQQQGPKQQVGLQQPLPGEKHKHICCGCGAEGENFKRCSVCLQRFCSAQCQKDSWKEHKKTCKPPST